jgi:hypothetical protein
MIDNQQLLDAACTYPEVYITKENDEWCVCIVNPLSGRKYALFAIDKGVTSDEVQLDFASLVTHINKGNRLVFKANGCLAVDDTERAKGNAYTL